MRILRFAVIFTFALLGGNAAFAAAGEPGIPFEMQNGLIWVKIASGRSTLDFVLDSGAGSTVLSLESARRLRLKCGAPCPVYGIGVNSTAYRIEDFAGKLGEIALKRDVYAIDLRSLGGYQHRRLDGLLGQDFFRGRVIQINFKTQRLQLFEKMDVASRHTVLPLRYQQDAMCVQVGVNKKKPEWTRLDTGSNSSLEWVPSQTGGKTGAERSQSRQEGIAEVQLGSESIAGVKIGLHPQPLFAGESGLLGNGLLSRYCVTIDARKMRLLLEKL